MISDLEKIAADENVRIIRGLAEEFAIKAYLVGGGVRDLLLGRRLKDLDFALTGACAELPRRFAQSIGGSFFWLDEERLQGRVVRKGGDAALTFDFAPQRGETIEEDLSQRDFTINALALPLAGGRYALIDPTVGFSDLQKGIIRACSPASFSDDPLRLLRAVRFAATLGFVIDEASRQTIAMESALLGRVAGERVRDELFQILAAPGITASLKALLDSGLLGQIVPLVLFGACSLPAAEEGRSSVNCRITVAGRVERIIAELADYFPAENERLLQHLCREVEGGISLLSLVKLAALIDSKAAPGMIEAVAEKLRLGNRSRRILRISARDGAPLAAMTAEKLSERAMYRFFRDSEPAGPGLIIIALAGGATSIELCARLIAYYFSGYVTEGADLLLSGSEVMRLLGCGPGPAIGEAMERLREAESTGMVSTKAEAEDFLKKNLLTKEEPIG